VGRVPERAVVHVDARFLDADPGRPAEAAAVACTERRAVLLLDTFEQCQALEAWLRDTSCSGSPTTRSWSWPAGPPRIPSGRWIPAGRSCSPSWPLDAARSAALLAARGVPAEQRDAFVAFAGGSPLALCLAASVPAASPGAPWEPTGEVLTTLVERLVGEVPGAAHRRALEVVARAYVTREPLLRVVLGEEDTAAVFSWLRQQRRGSGPGPESGAASAEHAPPDLAAVARQGVVEVDRDGSGGREPACGPLLDAAEAAASLPGRSPSPATSRRSCAPTGAGPRPGCRGPYSRVVATTMCMTYFP
jgi:hypothetical protein